MKFFKMAELSDKINSWAFIGVGTLAGMSGIYLIIDDPKKLLGYVGIPASLYFIKQGVDKLRKNNNYKKP